MGDSNKSIQETRAVMIKKYYVSKDKDRKYDNSTVYRFSTDQRIDIEQLNVKKQTMIDQHDEALIFRLSSEDSEIGWHLETVECKAKMRCPQYDVLIFLDNIYRVILLVGQFSAIKQYDAQKNNG